MEEILGHEARRFDEPFWTVKHGRDSTDFGGPQSKKRRAEHEVKEKEKTLALEVIAKL